MDDEKLLAELVHSGRDVVELAKAHGMTLTELVRQTREGGHGRLLADLCGLADAQTQLYISRSRAMAAARLADLTSPEDKTGIGAAQREAVRKACVDVLKMELKRVAEGENETAKERESEKEEEDEHGKSICKLFYEGMGEKKSDI